MKLIVETEKKSKVVDDSGNVMFRGTRIECLEFIADAIENNIEKRKKRKLNR